MFLNIKACIHKKELPGIWQDEQIISQIQFPTDFAYQR